MILWYYTIWYGIIYHVIWYNIISWYYIICYFTYWYDIVSNNDNVSYDTICSHMKWYCIMIRYIFLKRSCIIYDISFDIVSYNFVFYDITLFWYKRSATMISCIMIKMVLWRSCLVSVSFVISDYLCLKEGIFILAVFSRPLWVFVLSFICKGKFTKVKRKKVSVWWGVSSANLMIAGHFLPDQTETCFVYLSMASTWWINIG